MKQSAHITYSKGSLCSIFFGYNHVTLLGACAVKEFVIYRPFFKPCHEKTCFWQMQKTKGRSAVFCAGRSAPLFFAAMSVYV